MSARSYSVGFHGLTSDRHIALVEHTEKDLEAALQQLERIGRLLRPNQDQWRSDSPLPVYFVPPRIRNE
jgi:hypothetical protein